MKRKRRPFNLFLACATIIVFAILMGASINAGFVIDQWFIPVFGEGSWLNILIAVSSGALIGLGCYGLYQHSEGAIKSAYNQDEPDWLVNIRIVAIVLLNLLFLGIGVVGLLYRLQFVHTPGVQYLIIIGICLEVSTPIFGIVTYPMRKKPVHLAEEEMYEDFEREHIDELGDQLGGMDIGERHQVFTAIQRDDPDAVRDVIEEEVREEEARQRSRERAPQRKRFRAFTGREEEPRRRAPEPGTYKEEEVNFTLAQRNHTGQISR